MIYNSAKLVQTDWSTKYFNIFYLYSRGTDINGLSKPKMCHPEHSEESLIETHYEILRVALNDTYKKSERGRAPLSVCIYTIFYLPITFLPSTM